MRSEPLKVPLNPFDTDFNQLVFADPGAGMSFQANQLAMLEDGVFIIDVGPGYRWLIGLAVVSESTETPHES